MNVLKFLGVNIGKKIFILCYVIVNNMRRNFNNLLTFNLLSVNICNITLRIKLLLILLLTKLYENCSYFRFTFKQDI
ncbi:MAG: hypothetical protein A2068_05440 [Ignavibacteria bacterium GWB2_35_6b]|nr:MAG: hypothetical protein A2068_05440 [Ignavibacteria bacterium GWB2_35_6b]